MIINNQLESKDKILYKMIIKLLSLNIAVQIQLFNKENQFHYMKKLIFNKRIKRIRI